MPQVTGTRTAAQSASTTSGAVALAQYCKVPARRGACLIIKMGGPRAAQVIAQTESNSETELAAFDGIHSDRDQTQGNSDDGGNGKQRGPHGIASSVARFARGKSGRKNAQGGLWFPDFLNRIRSFCFGDQSARATPKIRSEFANGAGGGI